ncbi:carbohydrate-binding module family 13 protein [Auriculariales sp. MPI-PUGE-AT-0066]|nr:carbohydrate-binding module family 13 protein [Auriculariales sp. MPI-PUGE-AT-0066]
MLSLSLLTAALVTPALVAAQQPPYKSPFQFSNPQQLDGKKCITPAGGASKVGAALVLADCKNSAAQKITWTDKQVKSGNLCWSAKSGNGTVTLANCNTADGNQSWYFNKFGGRQVKHNPTGRCLNVNSASANAPVTLTSCGAKYAPKQVWNPYYQLGSAPAKSAIDSSQQYGTNQCGTNSTSSANCQNVYINSIDDFCLWAPPTTGEVGAQEQKGVHFVKTPTYVQISGVGDFTKVHIPKGDYGGELDPHGPTAMGNPIGALVYGNVHGSNIQYHEWSSFISEKEFCFRACLGPMQPKTARTSTTPANYDAGVFESCKGDETLPAGVYGTSTWTQGQKPTPAAHPPAASSQCARQATIKSGPLATAAPKA